MLPISLAEVIATGTDSALGEVHTWLPGRVLSFDAAKQVATVRPSVRRAVFDSEGERSFEDYPDIPNVPVACMQGGGFFMSFPIAVGDSVILLFCESSLTEWRRTGEVSNPGDVRRLSLGYPVAIPAIAPNGKALAHASATDLVIGSDGGGPRITLASDIKLGNASNFVALANLVQTALDSIRSIFNAHTHPETGVTTSTPTAAQLMDPLGPVAAAKVKAE